MNNTRGGCVVTGICGLIVCMAALAPAASGQRVTLHPDPSAALGLRWDWAMQEGARQGGPGFWVGYSIQRWMPEGEILLMLPGLTMRGYESTMNSEGTTLYELVKGHPPVEETLSEEEALRLEAERALARLQKETYPRENAWQEMALLFKYRRGAQGPGDIEAFMLGNIELSFDLEHRPLLWLGEANNEQSLSMLRRHYEQATATDLQERLVEFVGVHSDGARVVPFLQEVLQSRAADEVREEAASWLAHQDDERVLGLLTEVAKTDRSVDVREEAVEGIGYLPGEGATGALIELAETLADAELREEAVESLAHRGTPPAVAALERIAFHDASQDVQEEAVEGLAHQPGTEATLHLINIAQTHSREEVREEAVEQLGHLGSEPARRALERIVFEDPSADVQEEALEVFAHRSRAEGMPVLVRVARTHERASLREEALEYLGHVGTEEAVAVLEAVAFEDPSESVQEEALDALMQVAEGRGLPSVIRVAQTHPTLSLREEAIEHLGDSRDQRARRALETLIEQE